MSSRRIPVACSLDASEYGKRLGQWGDLIQAAALEVTTTTAGVRLLFPSAAGGEVERLAAAERDCCAFATWVVSRDKEDRVVLDVASEGMGIEAVRAMFPGSR